MFDRIASRYDMVNRILSFRRDVAWRKRLGRYLPKKERIDLLDLATGTGDVIVSLLGRNRRIADATGIDMSPRMLRVAAAKLAVRGLSDRAVLLQADAESLPFAEGSFDAVTIAFGIRNMQDVSRALREMHRVLAPGGKVLILEFSMPRNALVRRLYPLHLRGLLPRIGGLLSGDGAAYRYLNETVASFPCGEQFLALMRQSGFVSLAAEPLTFGVVTIYHGVKDPQV